MRIGDRGGGVRRSLYGVGAYGLGVLVRRDAPASQPRGFGSRRDSNSGGSHVGGVAAASCRMSLRGEPSEDGCVGVGLAACRVCGRDGLHDRHVCHARRRGACGRRGTYARRCLVNRVERRRCQGSSGPDRDRPVLLPHDEEHLHRGPAASCRFARRGAACPSRIQAKAALSGDDRRGSSWGVAQPAWETGYKEEHVRDALRECARAIGRSPKMGEYQAWREDRFVEQRDEGMLPRAIPSSSLIQNRYPTWDDALVDETGSPRPGASGCRAQARGVGRVRGTCGAVSRTATGRSRRPYTDPAAGSSPALPTVTQAQARPVRQPRHRAGWSGFRPASARLPRPSARRRARSGCW